VCRSEKGSTYGIGSYVGVNVTVSDRRVGFSHVICTGNAKGLEECIIGNLTSHNCAEAGIVQCFNDSQILVSITNVNKQKGSTYGIGSYVGVNVTVSDRRVGFSHVICTGNAKGLEECIIGNLTSHNCSEVGIVQCFNVSQVLVSRTDVFEPFEHVEISENEIVEFCIIVISACRSI
jgi:hypothetical protein